MKKFALLNLLVLLSLVLAACAPAAPAGPKVKMGVLIPETGALAEFGAGFRQSTDLAAKQFEEAGFPIELVYADTETSAMPAVEAARTLVDVEKVQVLIGAAASGVTIPIAESVAIPSGVPQISNASTSPLITVLPADEGKDYLFRTCFSDALQGIIAGKLAAEQGYKTASVIWVNNPYGEGLAENFKAAFEYRGGTVLEMVPHDEAVAPTYVSELKKAMEGEPDVLFCISYPGHATVYLKEFIEAGYNETTDLLFCDGTKSAEMPAEIGPEYLAGFYGTAPGSAVGAAHDAFATAFEEEYGELPPLPFMDTIYDGVVAAALAAAACDAKGMDITPTCIRDHLREVAKPPGETIIPGSENFKKALDLLKKGEAINYEGAAGSVDFDEAGDVITPVEIWMYTETEPYIESVSMEAEIPER
ncbi:MAG: amino acid ABC transporter substrate-binding protein [Chloroflexi bacterium]|nr:MAG: amino acid ABC transporter substrate-binding protein [Chloroflexota bacterium]